MMGILVFALILASTLFLLFGLPILALVDLLAEREKWGIRKILSAALIVLFWPVGSAIYAMFVTRRLALRIAALPVLLIGIATLWIGRENAAREEAKEAASLEKYSDMAETGLLRLTAAFGSYGPKGNDDYVQALSLSSDGSRLAVSGGRTLKLWEVRTQRPLATFEDLPANDILAGWLHGRWLGRGDAVALSPDGTIVAAYQGSVTVKLWAGLFPLARDFLDGRGTGVVQIFSSSRAFDLRAHRSNVSSMAFLPDGRHLLTGSYDGTLALWDVVTGERLLSIAAHPGWIQSVAVSSDGALALSGAAPPLTGRDTSRLLSLWDLATGEKKVDFVGHEDEVHAVGFAAIGTRGLSASYDGTFRLWDLATGRELRRVDGGRVVYRVGFSSDGRYAISGGETLHLWDLESGGLVDRIPLGAADDEAEAAAFSPRGDFLIVGTKRGALLRFDWK